MPRETDSPEQSQRLVSLDAYRGFVMLAMISGGLGLSAVVSHPKFATEFSPAAQSWWRPAAYEFSHVPWTGCSFWDLIQPSFMFIVGVALPFSDRKRQQQGQPAWRRAAHMWVRAAILVALGVFLYSNGRRMTNFVFVNVLAQIGLAYPVVYAFRNRSLRSIAIGAAVIAVGYWGVFAAYRPSMQERNDVLAYLTEVQKLPDAAADCDRFTGFAAHWNKHLNAAAAFDRWFLNLFPRDEPLWHGRRFWVNAGGYQTTNFVPSLITMLLGLMAGRVLLSDRSDVDKVSWLVKAGAICFAVSMPLDTSIWPLTIDGWEWHISPIVKRIWTPGFAVFSSGWTLWLLAAAYALIDMFGRRAWAWPLTVVGMNSILAYCMSQLLKPWIRSTLKTHLATVDALTGANPGIVSRLFGSDSVYAPLWQAVLPVFVIWLVCVWLYRRRIFVRV